MESESVVSVETTIPLFASSGMNARPVNRESPATWVERMPNKRLMLFSGRSNLELGERIAEQLGVSLAEVTLKTFTNGEVYARYEESIRGADVFIVQSCSTPSPNDSLLELLIMVQAARARVGQAGHGRDAVVPVRAAGQEGHAARAHHRQAGGRHARGRGR